MPGNYRVAVIGHTGRGNYGHNPDTVWLDLPETEIVVGADEDEAGRAHAAARLQVPRADPHYPEMLARLGFPDRAVLHSPAYARTATL